jgi:hypothetical protein
VCERCNQQSATNTCDECQTSLCAECCSVIHSLGVYKKHVVRKKATSVVDPLNLNNCPVHKKVIEFYREEAPTDESQDDSNLAEINYACVECERDHSFKAITNLLDT